MNHLDNVILIGMSGAGKSTLGVLLAKALGKQFTDTDILIQQKTGKLLQEIIDTEGVDRFLQIEEEVVSSLDLHNCVIATGGSVVYSDAAMHHLKAHGTAVYLSVDYDELFHRISNISDRGIVFKGKNDLRAVYEERLPLYRTYADITVECTGHGVEQSVDEITAALKKHNTRFILASKSPRRKEILESMGLHFEIVVADTDESSNESDPRALVELLSRRKGEAVRDLLLAEGRELADTVIIASDTVVAVDGQILGKPRDREDAMRMLRLLSGREHEVVSGICLIGKDQVCSSHEVTRVVFDALDEATMERYVAETNPYDKAGAYAIQGRASAFISGIHGCYFNVVGLPVHRLNTLYREIFKENLW